MLNRLVAITLAIFVALELVVYPLAGGVQRLLVDPYAYAMGLATLLFFFLVQNKYDYLSSGIWFLLLLIVVTPLLYLIPIPESIWAKLPGREIYSQVNQWVIDNYDAKPQVYSLSLIPYQTEQSLYALFPPLAIFIVVSSFSRQYKYWILIVFLTIAGLEACLAVIQFSSQDEYFFFGIPRLKKSLALGTYPNADHFSLLMAIAIPLVMALLFKQFRRRKKHRRKSSKKILFIMFYSTLIVLLFVSALFSGSRAGIALAILAIFLAYRRFSRRKKSNYLILIIMLAIGMAGLMMVLDIAPIINRFIKENPFIDGRWAIFSNSWDGIMTFFPVGSGSGTFPYVYKIFQPIEQAGFINHAHNDYIELIFETGILGLIGLIIFSIIFIQRWRKIELEAGRGLMLRQAAGISLLIMLLHSILEFNMHDSLNILFFAFLSALFFGQKGVASKRLNIDMGCLVK